MNREFREAILALGAQVGEDDWCAIVTNAFGQFQIDLEGAQVHYAPPMCGYCKDPCFRRGFRKVCMNTVSRGYSNLGLTETELRILAKIHAILEEDFDPQMERQLPNSCNQGSRRRIDFLGGKFRGAY